MDITISMTPGIVYAVLATVIAVTVVVTCYFDARNTINKE